MYEYRLVERFLGQHVVMPGKGFVYLTYEIPQENLEFLYKKGHPAVKRVKKKVEKQEDDKQED